MKKTRVQKDFYYTVPPADDLAGWVRLLDECRWMSIDDLIYMHRELHKTFGAEPNDAVIPGEQELSRQLRKCGIEHRVKDALSDAAGTTIEKPAAPKLEELQWYLEDIPVHSGIVKLMQGVDNASPVIALIEEQMLPSGMGKILLKQLNKMMPTGVTLKLPPKNPGEEFARQMMVYDLVLCSKKYTDVMIVPWKQLIDSAPELLLKSADERHTLQTPKATVLKSQVLLDDGDKQERFILGPVLYPEREDSQGDIYSHEEVLKACHWWAENSRVLSQKHVLQGGRTCGPEEMISVENYCTLTDTTLELPDGTKEEIPMGTWMMGAKAYGAELCAAIDRGEMAAWSIGAECLAGVEEVQDDCQ